MKPWFITTLQRVAACGTALKYLKTQQSPGKMLATVFCGSRGVILTDYRKKEKTINGEYYSSLLVKKEFAVFLFSKLKKWLAGQRFESNEDVKASTDAFLERNRNVEKSLDKVYRAKRGLYWKIKLTYYDWLIEPSGI